VNGVQDVRTGDSYHDGPDRCAEVAGILLGVVAMARRAFERPQATTFGIARGQFRHDSRKRGTAENILNAEVYFEAPPATLSPVADCAITSDADSARDILSSKSNSDWQAVFFGALSRSD